MDDSGVGNAQPAAVKCRSSSRLLLYLLSVADWFGGMALAAGPRLTDRSVGPG